MIDKELQELLDMADAMLWSERLVNMKQVIEITTLSRRTILNMEEAGEFPKRRQVSAGRTAWRLTDMVTWINNIPLKNDFYQIERPRSPLPSLVQKVERVQAQARAGKHTLIG